MATISNHLAEQLSIMEKGEKCYNVAIVLHKMAACALKTGKAVFVVLLAGWKLISWCSVTVNNVLISKLAEADTYITSYALGM